MADVVVLGCGPAGLIAAHAVQQAGHNPIIISRKQKSVIPGSMYLHEPIPGVSAPYPENTVLYCRIGTAEGYAKKVYGDEYRETGWSNYATVYPSWNVQYVYDVLWERYKDNILNREMDMVGIGGYLRNDTKLMISTLPQPTICYGEHTFEQTPYWIKTLPVPSGEEGRDVVVYNGLEDDDWYRWSILSGICSIEYAAAPGSYASEYKQGVKAIDNNCDCWPEVVRAGRWAQWRHGILLHDVYRTATAAVEGI